MPADISQSLKDWSTTPGSNLPTGGTLVGGNLDDNLRNIQAALRADVASRDSIASAATTDLDTKDAGSLDVTGTVTISSLGTVSAGIRKTLTFGAALILTHNATSLILPTGANITTAAGDSAEFVSLGGGNWRCLWFQRASGLPLNTTASWADGTAASPSAFFTADANTGLYRVGADQLGVSAGGAQVANLSHSAFSLTPTDSTNGSTITATISVSHTSAAAGSAVLNMSASEVASTGGATVNVFAGSAVATAAKLVLVNAGYGGIATLNGGDYPASTGGTAGTVNVKGGDHSTLLGATQIGGDANVTGGLGYLSGNVSITAQATLINSAYAEYGKITISAQRCGLQFRQVAGIIKDTGVAPTISSGAGSGATIAGTLRGFEITAGTGAGASIVVNLQGASGLAPAPFAIAQTSANRACWCTTTDQQVTIDLASAPSAAEKVRVFLMYV